MARIKSNLARYGTDDLPTQSETVVLGQLSFLFDSNGIRQLCWNKTEVIRGLSVAVRDANWGSAAAENIQQDWSANDSQFLLKRRVEYFAGALEAELIISATAQGALTAEFKMIADKDVQLNRAGFSLLHPLQGVVGQAAAIVHQDGSQEITKFPDQIAAGQPALDIVGLRHQVGNVDLVIDFQGEVFEMEDQRNWSDASFKTYCRPLALPFPYRVAKGEPVQQSVHIRLSDAKTEVRTTNAETVKIVKSSKAPDILLASQPQWQNPKTLPASGILARFETGADIDPSYITNLARQMQQNGTYLDAEIVVSGDRDPIEAVTQIATQLNAAGIAPRHIIALPKAYLKSHQPSGPWPDGPTPQDCAKAVTAAFPDCRTGVGMLTNFTELNRCPPIKGHGDYITHGNAAIVHAADDKSVLETLEALPQIFASGHALADGRDYRLGLVSIGMRGNPYGASLNDNAIMQRMTMADRDPRQQGLFAAAYAIGVTAAVVQSGIDAVALAATAGPFAITNADHSLRPIYHAVKALSAVSGRPVTPLFDLSNPVLGLSFDSGIIIANCGFKPVQFDCPHKQATILNVAEFAAAAQNPDWCKAAETPISQTITLAPFDCLFSGVQR